jgi:hypothetical protein
MLQSQQARTQLGLLVRVVSNLMGRRTYWAPGLGNICGIVTNYLFDLTVTILKEKKVSSTNALS